MGDSMEEDFDSVGVIVANGSGSHTFTGPHNSMGYATSAPTAGMSEALRGPPDVWARKRGRPGLVEGVGEASTSANCARIVNGVHLPSTRGRESPDSDMSSSGSDVSINRAIKRMRIDIEQQQQQQQRQLNDQQHPPSEFGGLLSSGGGSRPPPAWSLRAGVENDIDALRRKHAELATEAENARINKNPARPTAAPIPLHHSVAIPQAIHHHPRLLTITERSLSDSLSSIGPLLNPLGNGTNGPLLERSTSGSTLQSRAAGGPGNPRLPAPSDSCAAFSPFTPRPPAEARYVKGIRVQADAPADVDYLNVNHALRQLHMERKMMSAGREIIGNGGASAGCLGGRPSR